MRWKIGVLLLAGACATGSAHGPRVRVSAARANGGVRVWFRRTKPGVADHVARLEADGGKLRQVIHSPDLETASALWEAPRGELRCSFPYGGVGVYAAGGATDDRELAYVFLEERGVRVTGAVPRGCPMLPALSLTVELTDAHLPARLVAPGLGGPWDVRETTTRHTLVFPRDARGVLREGDLELALETARGRYVFLLGVEADGAVAAVSGHFKGAS